MALTTAAVDATPGNSEVQQTLWLSVMAFGKQAEQLLKHSKGELISLHGKATQNTWKDKDGNERTGLTLIVDSIVSARTARPGGGRKSQANNMQGFNDPVPSTFG